MLKLFVVAHARAAHALSALREREKGETVAEYGVVITLIAAAVIVAISLLSDRAKDAIAAVANIMPGS